MPTIGGGAVNGASGANTVTVTAAYTVQSGDELVLADATAGAFTVKLPAPTKAGSFDPTTQRPDQSTLGATGNIGQRVTVVKVDTGGNAVTVDGATTNTIRAGGKVSLASNDSNVTFICDGSFWNAVSKVS